MENIKPLTLEEYAKKRNEIAKRYGNKPRAPYMWKSMYQFYLEDLEKKEPTTLAVYHNIKVSAMLDDIADALQSKGLLKQAFDLDKVSDLLDKITVSCI